MKYLTQEDYDRLHAEAAEGRRLSELVNTPELHSFRDGVLLEAVHQRERFDAAHDGGKKPEDWYWLIGNLAGRALAHHKEADRLQAEINDDTTPAVRAAFEKLVAHHREKAVHHTITTAAACANWHAAVLGLTNMRPGLDPSTISALS